MEANLRRFLSRLRRKLAFITDSFTKVHATLKPEDADFRPQRMCPFCGLITSRQKTCCLECGRSLKPA